VTSRHVSADEVDALIVDMKATAAELRAEENRRQEVADRLDGLAERLAEALQRIEDA